MPEPYQQALQLLRDLGAERALVLQGPEPLKVRAAYGLREDQPWTDQISLSLLQKSLGEGECLLLGDAQTSSMAGRWSLAVSEIRSVLCVPFWSPSSRIVGILYADTRSRAGVFGKKAMETMQACARNLERALYGGSQAQAVPVPQPPPGQERAYPSGSLGLRPARPVSRAEATPPAEPPPCLGPKSRARPSGGAARTAVRSPSSTARWPQWFRPACPSAAAWTSSAVTATTPSSGPWSAASPAECWRARPSPPP